MERYRRRFLALAGTATALLAMGDALAVVLINMRHFKSSDFKRIHPGGNLGQRLSNSVADIMLTGEKVPLVSESVSMAEAVAEMNRLELGAVRARLLRRRPLQRPWRAVLSGSVGTRQGIQMAAQPRGKESSRSLSPRL